MLCSAVYSDKNKIREKNVNQSPSFSLITLVGPIPILVLEKNIKDHIQMSIVPRDIRLFAIYIFLIMSLSI